MRRLSTRWRRTIGRPRARQAGERAIVVVAADHLTITAGADRAATRSGPHGRRQPRTRARGRAVALRRSASEARSTASRSASLSGPPDSSTGAPPAPVTALLAYPLVAPDGRRCRHAGAAGEPTVGGGGAGLRARRVAHRPGIDLAAAARRVRPVDRRSHRPAAGRGTSAVGRRGEWRAGVGAGRDAASTGRRGGTRGTGWHDARPVGRDDRRAGQARRVFPAARRTRESARSSSTRSPRESDLTRLAAQTLATRFRGPVTSLAETDGEQWARAVFDAHAARPLAPSFSWLALVALLAKSLLTRRAVVRSSGGIAAARRAATRPGRSAFAPRARLERVSVR